MQCNDSSFRCDEKNFHDSLMLSQSLKFRKNSLTKHLFGFCLANNACLTRGFLSSVLMVMVIATTIVQTAVIDEESDLPVKRLNAGQYMQIRIPMEMALERLRSMPHRRNALIRSLGATALTQRAGRNLIFRVFLTIGHQNGLTQCTAQMMCEQMCQAETNKMAVNFFDTYPTDDYFVSFVLGAIEKGRELGASYHCEMCKTLYPKCFNTAVREQVLSKFLYLLEITNYVLEKVPK